ncbi:MAG: MATE family efflux transporter [Lachnospiraceae bacterium]|nr:MATE family efflux transporter [Lachnospiraceae bacterium]
MDNREYLFREMPVQKAVLTLVVPTVVSQLITMIYNLADTFFIGQLNDPRQVAAATVSMPLFVSLTALSNLFGIGGASKISRCLGRGETENAAASASFAFWTAAVVSLIYGIVILLAAPALLPVLGAKADTYDYCYRYIFWVVVVGALPTVLNVTMSHLVRAEGYSRQAGFGVALGGVLNIVLDPVFIYGLKLEIRGAAIATMLSNLIAALFFLIFLYRKRKSTVITLDIRRYAVKNRIASDILLGGLPSFTMMMLSCLSNSVLNHLITSWSTEAMAGMGIAKKIDMVSYSVAQGMTQGVLPLIAYNYASGDKKRMNKSIGVTLAYTLTFSVTALIVLYFFAEPVVQLFIKDPETVAYGQKFVKIICFLCPSTGINYMVIAVFQATKQRTQSIILSVLRKGSLDIPLMIAFSRFFGVEMVAWASPISDWIALVVALFMLIPFLKKMRKQSEVGGRTEQIV